MNYNYHPHQKITGQKNCFRESCSPLHDRKKGPRIFVLHVIQFGQRKSSKIKLHGLKNKLESCHEMAFMTGKIVLGMFLVEISVQMVTL